MSNEPLQLFVEHQHGGQTHGHQNKGVYNRLPEGQGSGSKGRHKHYKSEDVSIEHGDVSLKCVYILHSVCSFLPIILAEFRIIPFRTEEGIGGHKHPKNGQFIEQLPKQTECGMEVHWAESHNDEQRPEYMYSGGDAASVLLEKVHQHWWQEYELNIANLQRARNTNDSQ